MRHARSASFRNRSATFSQKYAIILQSLRKISATFMRKWFLLHIHGFPNNSVLLASTIAMQWSNSTIIPLYVFCIPSRSTIVSLSYFCQPFLHFNCQTLHSLLSIPALIVSDMPANFRSLVYYCVYYTLVYNKGL